MKRLLVLIIIILFTSISLNVSAKDTALSADADISNYTRFSSMQISKGKLLSAYTKGEINTHMKTCNKRKFAGWRISFLNKRVRCNFTSKTILSIYNDGTSAITYKLSETQTRMYKTSISATGSLSGSGKGDIKKFKGGLDAKIGMEASYTKTIEVKTAESLEIQVDAGTKATIYLKGSGYLTTGCACYYSLWTREFFGCFEFFEIVDCYPKIVKEKI